MLGFDDIHSAAFQIPSLTTVRQPLDKMGAAAAEILLQGIQGAVDPVEFTVKPELVLRESTAPVKASR